MSFFHGVPELLILQDLPVGLDLGMDHLLQLLFSLSKHEEICNDLPVVFFPPNLGVKELHEAGKVVLVSSFNHPWQRLVRDHHQLAGVDEVDDANEGFLIHILEEHLTFLALPHVGEDSGSEHGRSGGNSKLSYSWNNKSLT